jgi:hypothetical protein
LVLLLSVSGPCQNAQEDHRTQRSLTFIRVSDRVTS